MAFNPNLPIDGSLIEAGELRNQFNGLHDEILSIPVGPQGPPGTNGTNGTNGTDGVNGVDGAEGPMGPQGPAFATCVVDSTTTGLPGSSAEVTANYDGIYVHLNFVIPAGIEGQVSTVNLNDAIAVAVAQTSNISNAVDFISTPFADPDAEALRLKLNELILALRR